MRDEFFFRNLGVLVVTSRMVRVLWEVPVPRVIVLLLRVVALDVVRRVIHWVFVVVAACVLVQIVVVRIAHWIVEVVQVMRVPLFEVSVAVLELMFALVIEAILFRHFLVVGELVATVRSLIFDPVHVMVVDGLFMVADLTLLWVPSLVMKWLLRIALAAVLVSAVLDFLMARMGPLNFVIVVVSVAVTVVLPVMIEAVVVVPVHVVPAAAAILATLVPVLEAPVIVVVPVVVVSHVVAMVRVVPAIDFAPLVVILRLEVVVLVVSVARAILILLLLPVSVRLQLFLAHVRVLVFILLLLSRLLFLVPEEHGVCGTAGLCWARPSHRVCLFRLLNWLRVRLRLGSFRSL